MEKDIKLGKIDYNHSGRKNCPVTVTIKLSGAEDKPTFSACVYIWNPKMSDIYCGGQCFDEVAKYLGDNPTFKTIYRLWKSHHLNDMHAGTPRQEEEIERYKKECQVDRMTIEQIVNHLADVNLMIDDGYSYGSSWLYRSIPEADIAVIKYLLEDYED